MLRPKVVCFLMGIIFMASFPAITSADLQFRVTKVQAWVTENNYKGECPHSFEFRASITVNKAGTVKYKWIQSHNQLLAKIRTLKFTKPGTKTVKSNWTLGEAGKKYTNYWKKVEIIAPNSLVSNLASFNLECMLSAKTEVSTELFPYSISGNIAPYMTPPTLEGRKVIIKLKKDGTTVRSLEKSLGYNGRLQYMFKVRFPGNYSVYVEKGPSDPDNYVSQSNICWESVSPTYRPVVVTAARKEYVHNDFTINYELASGAYGWCWIP
jgi:hypothetical protein